MIDRDPRRLAELVTVALALVVTAIGVAQESTGWFHTTWSFTYASQALFFAWIATICLFIAGVLAGNVHKAARVTALICAALILGGSSLELMLRIVAALSKEVSLYLRSFVWDLGLWNQAIWLALTAFFVWLRLQPTSNALVLVLASLGIGLAGGWVAAEFSY